MNYLNQMLNESTDYWDIVGKMWGETTAQAVRWVVTALLIAGVIVGTILVMFKIISGAMTMNKEQDCGLGQALKESTKPMIKFIILIAVAGIAIPLLWNFLFPFLVAQGWKPTPAPTLAIINNFI